MSEEKKYVLEIKCDGLESHDGERWINDEEFSKIKQQAGTVSPGCSVCSLRVKDADGNILFTKEGC